MPAVAVLTKMKNTRDLAILLVEGEERGAFLCFLIRKNWSLALFFVVFKKERERVGTKNTQISRRKKELLIERTKRNVTTTRKRRKRKKKRRTKRFLRFL